MTIIGQGEAGPKVPENIKMPVASSFDKQHKGEKGTLLLKTQKSGQSQNIKKGKKFRKGKTCEDPVITKEESKPEEKPKSASSEQHTGHHHQAHCNGQPTEMNVYNHYHNQVIHQHQIFYQGSPQQATPHQHPTDDHCKACEEERLNHMAAYA